MRLLVLLSCAFLLGWVLSWMYYVSATDTASSAPADSTTLSSPSTTDSPSVSADSGESPPQSAAARQSAYSDPVLQITLDRLRKGEFEAVMAEYPNIQSELSASDAIAHRKIIIDHARALLESGQAAAARALLALYLQQEFRDVAALLLMARVFKDSGNEMEAIEVLFQARSYAYTPGSIEQTEQAIRAAVRRFDAQLSARNDGIAQLNLYQRLTELEPDYTLHYIGLAETYLALGNAVDARKALELTRHDAAVADRANDILRRIEAQTEPDRYYAAEISLQAFGNQFLVDARLNNTRDAVLLLDTGASLSIISTGLMAALGIPNRPTGRMAWFSTAGGRIEAPIVQLDSLALDGVEVVNIEVGVIGEFDNNQFDGLLGMNFLRHFEFFIDQNANKLQLNPRR